MDWFEMLRSLKCELFRTAPPKGKLMSNHVTFTLLIKHTEKYHPGKENEREKSVKSCLCLSGLGRFDFTFCLFTINYSLLYQAK